MHVEKIEATELAQPRRRSVAGISPPRYQHPLDATTVATLRNSAGVEDLVRLFSEHYPERYARLSNVAACVRVGPVQFPKLYDMYLGCCGRLGVRPEPELYVGHDFNAFTAGVERPYVMLGGSLAASCTPRELEFVLGHELGHIRLRHVLYQQIAEWGPRLVGQVPMVGRLLGAGLRLALFEWSRAAEFSADRAGLLACQDVNAALRLLMKLSGVPGAYYGEMQPAAFIAQAEEYRALGDDWLGYLVRALAEGAMTHPWTVLRAAEIQRWHNNGEYESLLAEDGSPEIGQQKSDVLLAPAKGFSCPVCRTAVPASERFCSRCGAPVSDKNRMHECPSCKNECTPDLPFCDSCGYRFQSSASGGR